MKKILLSEDELINVIKILIPVNEQKKKNASSFTVEPEIPETPRETQIKQSMGSYSALLDDDIIRYLRKNPRLFFRRLWDMYGEKAYKYLDLASGRSEMSEDVSQEDDIALAVSEKNPDLGLALMDEQFDFDEEEDDYDPRKNLIEKLKSIIENDEDLDEMDIMEIYEDGKPFRSGRGSIYVDILVPETDDREFDREVALKMMKYYSKQVNDENYVGGVGFKTGNVFKPYDTENF
jgi:hypothetical protein